MHFKAITLAFLLYVPQYVRPKLAERLSLHGALLTREILSITLTQNIYSYKRKLAKENLGMFGLACTKEIR